MCIIFRSNWRNDGTAYELERKKKGERKHRNGRVYSFASELFPLTRRGTPRTSHNFSGCAAARYRAVHVNTQNMRTRI